MRSTQQRRAAVLFLSAVILIVLGLIVYTERVNATATVTVLELTHDVTAGATYTPGDIVQVQIRASAGDFNYETRDPSEFAARYAVDLSAHDILRSDDLVAAASQSEVALTVVNPPPVAPGDRVDIYAALPSGSQALIGRDIVVVGVNGGALTVLVPAADEPSWVAVSAAVVDLHVARSAPGTQITTPALGAPDAIRILCGDACANQPSSSPAPTP